MKSLKSLAQKPFMLIFYVIIALALVLNIFVAGYWFGRAREFSEHFSTTPAQAQNPS